jgi:hypothetical protein
MYAVAEEPEGVCQVAIKCLDNHKCKIKTGGNISNCALIFVMATYLIK